MKKVIVSAALSLAALLALAAPSKADVITVRDAFGFPHTLVTDGFGGLVEVPTDTIQFSSGVRVETFGLFAPAVVVDAGRFAREKVVIRNGRTVRVRVGW